MEDIQNRAGLVKVMKNLSKDFEEEIPASPPLSNKKRKRASESTSTPKKNKKSKKGNAHDSDGEVEPNEGIWGAKDEDDGAMDSDFEFALEGGEGRMEDFEGWGFEGAKKGLNGVSGGDKRAVDIDDIIARRREKKNGEKVVVPEANEDTTAGDSDDQDVEDVEALELENSGDEFMAEDGFGMGAGSADEDSDDQQDVQDPELSGEDGEDDGSDNESVASAVPHPDDEVPEASSDEEDNDEDPEEAARREAFFAPEEKPAKATKLASHTDIKFCLAVGGLSLKVQEAELRLRPDVIIATPVLDEADRMLEAGFADELNEILTTIPKSRQTMLFSATMTSSVDNLIRVGLNRPVRILVDAQKQTVGTLIQEFIRLRPGRETKRMGYLLYLCANVYTDRVIVFFRQKKEAHRARVIFGLSGLKATELHGSMSQEQRIISVEAFRDGKASFLLATDLASRGLDIKGVDTVINYEAPQSHEIYLHRVGRTARAGRQGRACTLAAEPDRKIVKAAVKSGRSQGAKIVSRVIEAADADTWAEKVEEMQDEIEEILKEEKEDKQLAQVEMQVRKGENMINHEDEIKGRPKRTWFESEVEKTAAKKAGRAELNGVESILKKKPGKLSNKDKKKLDDRDVRMEGKVWKKGRAERDGKGALAKAEKGKKKMKGGKPPGKPTKGKFGKKR
ncbi:putative ATP-dependent RNA helicase drs1 [Glarea lozoyensis 74030]|uniref:RNA helicase n=1 Tax=Glarea lozoyensis (strain ATCC 74030 / MF5533) TaxID=1104152 RepID=H0ETP2_GLAL7|nr:putative ATP-dependent RNA helicase drs1 [Glarea lozoyensis 74030]